MKSTNNSITSTSNNIHSYKCMLLEALCSTPSLGYLLTRGVLLPCMPLAWYNCGTIETSNILFVCMFHENLWCYKDLHSLLFYFEISRSQTGVHHIMSYLEMPRCNQFTNTKILKILLKLIFLKDSICNIKCMEIDDN